MTNNRETTVITERLHPMHPIHQDIHVAYRHDELTRQAAAERLATAQRQHHVEEHEAHPTLVHDHAATGMRGTVGRLLIALGTTIAGDVEAGARRTA
jgi:hypothetical protein